MDILYPKKKLLLDDVTYTNIFRIVDLSRIVRPENLIVFELSGETPMKLALDLYGNSKYFWVNCLINGVVNYHTDWYMGQQKLERFCRYKYGDHQFDPYRFLNTNTKQYVTDSEDKILRQRLQNNQALPNNIRIVTYSDYEFHKNEARRTIYILPPDLLMNFLKAYEKSNTLTLNGGA